MKLEISAIGENESFARSTVAAFALSLNPSLSELSDIKTAVSEAVTNCIVHAYGKRGGAGVDCPIFIECETVPAEDGEGGVLHISVTDRGCGIEDVDKAMQPFYTTLKDDERSGMGFTVMQAFMSELVVTSEKGKGTSVRMSKKIGVKDGCDA
jgi:stage II sporulation protein AB (anti-sigma F factor)